MAVDKIIFFFFFFFSVSVHQLLEENANYLSQLSSMLQETTKETEYSVLVRVNVWVVLMPSVTVLTVFLYL